MATSTSILNLLWPKRVLQDNPLAPVWEKQDRHFVALATRGLGAICALGLLLHHAFIDIPLGLGNQRCWILYRFGGAALGLLAALSTYLPAYRTMSWYRLPLGVFGLVISTTQAAAMAWWEGIPYGYAVFMPCVVAYALNDGPIESALYVASSLLLEALVFPSWQGDKYLILSAAIVGIMVTFALRLRAHADICAFLTEKARLVAQKRLTKRTRQLAQARKRLAVLERAALEKQLAGGFAHEMGNILGAANLLSYQPPRRPASRRAHGTRAQSSRQRLLDLCNATMGDTDKAQAQKDINTLHRRTVHLRRTLADTHRVIQRGLGVVAGIVGYARVARENTESLELSDIQAIVASTMRKHREALATKAICYTEEIDSNARARVTGAHLELLLSHLVGNAVESFEDAPISERRAISIVVSVTPQHALLSVQDTGPGLRSRDRRRVFEPFFTTKGPLHTGLGLAIVRRIVAIYGGRVRCDAAVERGAKFTVVLPHGAMVDEPHRLKELGRRRRRQLPARGEPRQEGPLQSPLSSSAMRPTPTDRPENSK